MPFQLIHNNFSASSDSRMGKEDENKAIKKKLEEKEEALAEADRAIAVAKMKEAHGQIELVQKGRKSSPVLSIGKRIDALCDWMIRYLKPVTPLDLQSSVSYLAAGMKVYWGIVREYDSIRRDFREVMEINEEHMNGLFPRVDTNLADVTQEIHNLANMNLQLEQMGLYLLRAV